MRVDSSIQDITKNSTSVSQTATKPKEEASSSAKSAIETSKELSEEKSVSDLKSELLQVTEQLNKEINPLNTNIEFGFSDDIKGMFVTVFEKDSQKVIRKIPSDEAMELMAKMREIVGIIFDKKG